MSTVSAIPGGVPPIKGAAGAEAADVGAPAAAAAASPDIYINPQIQVDPANGVVILEYRDAGGKLVHQVPSEYELRSYQRGPSPEKGNAVT